MFLSNSKEESLTYNFKNNFLMPKKCSVRSKTFFKMHLAVLS